MIWQDVVIAVANVVFSVSLIPQVHHGFKKKVGPIKFQTSIPISLGLSTIAFTFFTLSLCFSAVVSFIQGALWLVLAIQRLIYSKKSNF